MTTICISLKKILFYSFFRYIQKETWLFKSKFCWPSTPLGSFNCIHFYMYASWGCCKAFNPLTSKFKWIPLCMLPRQLHTIDSIISYFQITFHNGEHNGQMLIDLQSYITYVDCRGTIISDSKCWGWVVFTPVVNCPNWVGRNLKRLLVILTQRCFYSKPLIK